jgi:hypothetical protein
MKSLWFPTLAWAAAVAAAVSLAVASPTDSTVMGKLPTVVATRADRQPVPLPEALPGPKTLALITFRRDQREAAEAWIEGMGLRDATPFHWVRMTVLPDPGDPSQRAQTEERLLRHYATDRDRNARLAVITDRDQFLRETGLWSHEQVSLLVLGSEGEVLARVSGPFDQDKAATLRETLLSHSL